MAKAFTNALPGLLAGSVGTMYLVEQTILNPNNANSNSNNSPSLFGALLQNLFSARQNSNSNNGGLLSQQPLVINMPGGSPNSNQKQLLTYLLGPVLIFWGGYFLSHALPSSISDLLPVSKALFSSAVGAIGRGLINVRDDLVKVRDSLLKQFDILNKKHDDLAEDVDSIKKDSKSIKKDVATLRLDLSDVHNAVKRCEALGLNSADEQARQGNQQNYVARGTRLLLHVVGTILPVGTALEEELKAFTKELEGNEQKLQKALGEEGKNENYTINVNPESFNSPEKVRPSSYKSASHHKSPRRANSFGVSSYNSPAGRATSNSNKAFTTPTRRSQSYNEKRNNDYEEGEEGGLENTSVDFNTSFSSGGGSDCDGSDTSIGMITLTPGKSLEDQIGHLMGGGARVGAA